MNYALLAEDALATEVCSGLQPSTAKKQDAVRQSREGTGGTAPSKTCGAHCIPRSTFARRRLNPLIATLIRVANGWTIAYSVGNAARNRSGWFTLQLMYNMPVSPCKPAQGSLRYKGLYFRIISLAIPTSQYSVKARFSSKEAA